MDPVSYPDDRWTVVTDHDDNYGPADLGEAVALVESYFASNEFGSVTVNHIPSG